MFDALCDWLEIRGEDAGPLFLAINKAGDLGSGRMTSQAIYNALSKRAHTTVRVGLEYYNGHSALTQFFQDRDHYLGFGFWLHF